MITGFNTEFNFNGRVYHVQTEDKGLANPIIQTLIYVRGEILDSLKCNYSDLLENPPAEEREILKRMEEQHKQMVGDIKNGKYDFAPNSQDLAQQSIFNDRPLEEAIIEYLQDEGDIETLELILSKPLLPKFDSAFSFSVQARLCISKHPVSGAQISVRLISNLKTALLLITGKTDDQGVFSASVNLPPSQPGRCAILVSCASEYGNDEIRALISA